MILPPKLLLRKSATNPSVALYTFVPRSAMISIPSWLRPWLRAAPQVSRNSFRLIPLTGTGKRLSKRRFLSLLI